jgi:hypothetical protein
LVLSRGRLIPVAGMEAHSEAPLEPEDVIPYLLEGGLVSRGSIVCGQAEVSVQVRKNTSYVARFGDSSFVLKRAKMVDDPGVHREAAFYATVLPDRAALRTFTPDFLGYDQVRAHIIIRHFPRHQDLRRRFARSGPAPPAVGARLGQALATLHTTALTDWETEHFETPSLWVLTLLEPPMEMLVTESPGTVEIIRRVQANRALASLIERLNEAFRADGLCHGDMRLDNLLTGSKPPLVIVDWELSGLGWTAWDLGCLMASFVELWVTAAVRPPDDPGGATTATKWSLVRFRPVLTRFWADYRARRGAEPDWPAWPKRVSELVGLRLVQSALEYSQLSVAPTRESVMLLSLAERFAARPLEGWVHILGLPLSTSLG